MKNMIFASLIALASVSAAIAPSQAATVVLKTHDHMHMMKKHCHTKMVTTWKNHRKVVRKVNVCK